MVFKVYVPGWGTEIGSGGRFDNLISNFGNAEPAVGFSFALDGLVAFAGVVAGSLHVVVDHGDGIRTSYSFLARVDVVARQRVPYFPICFCRKSLIAVSALLRLSRATRPWSSLPMRRYSTGLPAVFSACSMISLWRSGTVMSLPP